MKKSKAAIARTKIMIVVQMLVSIIMLLFSTLFLVLYISDWDFAESMGVGQLIIYLSMFVLGITILAAARKSLILLREFKRYVAALGNVENGSIPRLAQYLGAPEEQVRKNLNEMIKRRYFVNAYIDNTTNCLVIANRNHTAANGAQVPHPAADTYTAPVTTQAPAMVTVKCKGCGGINTIQRGTVGVCDYCGSSIAGE